MKLFIALILAVIVGIPSYLVGMVSSIAASGFFRGCDDVQKFVERWSR